MKKLFAILGGLLTASLVNAQCTPDPALAGESFGLWPDSLSTVYTCAGCGDHSRYVDLVTFTDTVIEVNVGQPTEVTVYIDAFKIIEVREVPAGMSYGTNVESDTSYDAVEAPWGIWFNNGEVPNQTPTQGCVYINGPEAEWNTIANGGLGAIQMEIDVDARIAATDPDISSIIPNGSWMSEVPPSFGGGPITVDDYWLVAQASSVGINEANAEAFALVGNYPNPASSATTISFNAPTTIKNLSFNLHNTLGGVVYTKTLSGHKGLNSFTIDAGQFATGHYLYTLSDGQTVLTGKMEVR